MGYAKCVRSRAGRLTEAGEMLPDIQNYTQTHSHTHSGGQEDCQNHIPCLISSTYTPLSFLLWIPCLKARCCSLLASWQHVKLSRKAPLAGRTAESQWKRHPFTLVTPVFQFLASVGRPFQLCSIKLPQKCLYEQPDWLTRRSDALVRLVI